MLDKIISFKTAKALKDAGIIIKSELHYDKNGNFYRSDVGVEVIPAPCFPEIWEFLPPAVDNISYLNLFKSRNQRWENGVRNSITIPHDVIGYMHNLRVDNAFEPEKSITELAAELCLELQKKGLLK